MNGVSGRGRPTARAVADAPVSLALPPSSNTKARHRPLY